MFRWHTNKKRISAHCRSVCLLLWNNVISGSFLLHYLTISIYGWWSNRKVGISVVPESTKRYQSENSGHPRWRQKKIKIKTKTYFFVNCKVIIKYKRQRYHKYKNSAAGCKINLKYYSKRNFKMKQTCKYLLRWLWNFTLKSVCPEYVILRLQGPKWSGSR